MQIETVLMQLSQKLRGRIFHVIFRCSFRKKGMRDKKVLYALVATGLVCFIWYIWQKGLRSRAQENFLLSNGTFDTYAEKALDNLEKIQCPTSRDHFLAARLVDLNAHEGRINNVRVLNDVVNRYMTGGDVERDGGDPSLLNWFEIDQIENFIERHMDIMAGNPNYNNFIERALAKRPRKITSTIEQVREKSRNKSEAYETFAKENQTGTSDAQNVHDSAVNQVLRATLEKLKKEAPVLTEKDRSRIFTDVQRYIKRACSGKKALRAGKGLEEMTEKSKFNGTLNVAEGDLVALVWSRSFHPINAKNRKLIQDAIIESLSDMVTDDSIDDHGSSLVCSNGRCARLMESLVHTDADQETVLGAMTLEQLRNDAFTLSNKILQDTISLYSHSQNAKLRNVAQSYKDSSVKTDPESEYQFKVLVKEKINKELEKAFKKRLSEKNFSKLVHHCLSAI
jgi:uncharacterized short protein YbdD (DUF466 family)